jgi:Flp pilus assembly protein TadD
MNAQPPNISVNSDFPRELPARFIRGEVTLGQAYGLDQKALYEIAGIGYQLLNSGKLHEARQIYAGLVAADPYDSVFHCHLGAALHRLGEIDSAFAQYDDALKLNFANCDALVGRGEISLSHGDLAQGVADLKSAVTIDREGTRPSTARARALLLSLQRQAEQ